MEQQPTQDVDFKMPGAPVLVGSMQSPQKSKGAPEEMDLDSKSELQEPKNHEEADLGEKSTMQPPQMLPPPLVTSSSSPKVKQAPPVQKEDPEVRAQRLADKHAKYMEIVSSLKYNSPKTGASCADPRYSFEVLKTGTIVDKVEFRKEDNKGFYVVGRVPACDLVAENPTVSRTHAILQFVRGDDGGKSSAGDEIAGGEGEPKKTGMYLYDLDSTHGTFINKNQVFPRRYYRLHVGHVLKFGNSARLYILSGPADDEEEESDKSVTELQNERLQRELARKRLEEKGLLIKTGGGEGGDEGCSWGMGEDADEESDLRENPFAINFEETEGFDNPKKTLRGWFEREGYELVYDVREKAVGQFICRINLPLDGPSDQAVFAEVDVKGKKKEAVHQAALQACQILDKYGVLRQSHHESKGKRKAKNWDQDHYSSDEDTFLDRTGLVEKKREKKMKVAGQIEEKPETYESLSKKADVLTSQIETLQEQISKSQKNLNAEDEMDIDDYVKFLKTGGSSDIKKLKSQLRQANEEIKRVKKLLTLVKPAVLPPALVTNQRISVKQEETKVLPKVETHSVNESFTEVKSESKGVNKEAKLDSSTVTLSVPTPETASKVTSSTETSPPTSSIVFKVKQQKLYGPRVPAKALELESIKSVSEHPPCSSEDNVKEDSRKVEKASPIKEDSESSPDEQDEEKDASSSEASKKTKQKRNRQRIKVPKSDKYDYDMSDPKYSTWVPPSNQLGDGKTSLNEKLGY